MLAIQSSLSRTLAHCARNFPGKGSLIRACFSAEVTAHDSTTTVPPKTGPKMSFIEHAISLNDVPINEEPSPTSDRFAVIEFSGTQYKITLDDLIVANKMEGFDIGDIVNIDKVLLIGSRKGTVVGRPYIPGAQVSLALEEITKDKKVIIFKMRRRKNSKRTKGFRRHVSILRVQDIQFSDEHSNLSDQL